MARPARRYGWVLEFRIALVLSALALALMHSLANSSSTPARTAAEAPQDEVAKEPVEPSPRRRNGKGQEQGAKGPLVFESTGKLETVSGTSRPSGKKPVRTFTVKVEKGVPASPTFFAHRVEKVLGSRRSWSGLEGFSVQRVNREDADFHVILASPDTTDKLCRPLDTDGIHSCRRENRAILNALRWLKGAETYGNDLASYRTYLINHEVGHVWLHPHLPCPAAGEPAPVMVQQTIAIAPCKPNPWPLKSEAQG